MLFDTGPGFKSDEARERWNERAEGYAEAFEREGLDALSPSPEVGPGPHDPIGLARAARGILTQSDARGHRRRCRRSTSPSSCSSVSDDEPFLAATDYMAAKIPGATKVVVSAAGHASNIDQPAAFDAAVTDFLRRTDPR